jgi:hypothetical protein
MKHFQETFFRLTALTVLIVFTVVSCTNYFVPVGNPVPSEPANPGENVQLSFLNEEDQGRTLLFLTEDEDTFIMSEEGQLEDEVSLVSGGAGVIMVFSKGADFPNRMVMGSDEIGKIYGIFSEYDFSSSSYSVELVTEEGESQVLSNLILNRNIFSLQNHQDDWTESQNLRAQRMIIGMGLYESLSLNLENLANEASAPSSSARGIFDDAWKWLKKSVIEPAQKILAAVAVTAVVVALIVVPVANFIAPALALSAAAAWEVAGIATAWYGTLETVRKVGDGELTIEDIKLLIPSDAGGGDVTTQGNNETKASKPVISRHPAGGVFHPDNIPLLWVQANADDGGTLSYQWYVNTINSNSEGSLISGATSWFFTPQIVGGTLYYFVVVTNTNGTSTAAEVSDVAEIRLITRTGQVSQNGYFMVDRYDTGFPRDIELWPSNQIWNQPTAQHPGNSPARNGWRLPTTDELAQIYYLYLVGNKLTLNQIYAVIPVPYTTNFILTSQNQGMSVVALNLNIKETSTDNFSRNFVWIDVNDQVNALFVRDL